MHVKFVDIPTTQVSWSGVDFPAFDDLVALYLEKDNFHLSAPVKFQMAFRSASHLALGVGTLRFRC